MANSSISKDSRFGAALELGGTTGTIPVVALADVSGNLLGTTSNGDGTFTTSALTPFVALVYPSTGRNTANTGDSFATSQYGKIAVDITITSFTGGSSPSLTFFVRRLGGDGVYYQIWSSGALSTAGATSVNIGDVASATGSTPAVLTGTGQFGWTVAGSPSSFIFSAGVTVRP